MINEQRTEKFRISPEFAGKRADIVLSHYLPGQTRSQIKRLIDDKYVLVGGEPIKPSRKFDVGEIVHVTVPAPESLDAEPEDIPVEVIFEDDCIVVVNKPPGMTVHPGAGVKKGTLVNALLHRCKDLSGIGGKIRPGIVHRLDKNTSGIIVVAKNDMSHNSLVGQFKERTVHKIYMAVVEGVLKKDSGSFSSGIGRHPTNRIKMSSKTASGREALTLWKVVKRFKNASLVEAEPKTGRTHQIRVHFSENGHPILADEVYGYKTQKPGAVAAAAKKIGRQALHAYKIGFAHPLTKEYLELTAPMPEDMKEALKILERSGENS